ncbi:hypothetical protein Tco_1143437 [Tanacetum coccineum]
MVSAATPDCYSRCPTTSCRHGVSPEKHSDAVKLIVLLENTAATTLYNGLLVVSGSGPAVTSNWAVCCTLNPPVLPPIPPEGVKVPDLLLAWDSTAPVDAVAWAAPPLSSLLLLEYVESPPPNLLLCNLKFVDNL